MFSDFQVTQTARMRRSSASRTASARINLRIVAVFAYLRFCLAETVDLQDFEGDMRAMADLAEARPGYEWSEIGPSMADPSVYLVVSEWDIVEDVRSWEHEPVHVEIQQKWGPQFRETPSVGAPPRGVLYRSLGS